MLLHVPVQDELEVSRDTLVLEVRCGCHGGLSVDDLPAFAIVGKVAIVVHGQNDGSGGLLGHGIPFERRSVNKTIAHARGA